MMCEKGDGFIFLGCPSPLSPRLTLAQNAQPPAYLPIEASPAVLSPFKQLRYPESGEPR